MSDETPTERFDAAGSDTPTERFEAPAATLPLDAAEKRRSRRLIVILAAIGGALLLALLIVLILLLTRGGTPSALPTSSATPSVTPTPTVTASTTPSATPEPTPTVTQTVAPPPSTDTAVESFTINPTTVDCSGVSSVVITLKWSTSNANNVYFGIDTNDAQAAPFFSESLPASGTSTNDFPNGYRPFEYTCGNGSHTYAITAVSADGSQKDTSTVTVTG
ncbi:MAG: hypothetical protein KF761_11365 [Salinibacterium sp.]|nr:hypothetical protein [Salinibacterium sp.]